MPYNPWLMTTRPLSCTVLQGMEFNTFFFFQSFDADQKRSEKLDSSGCVYQYDNYEEVAMDTDSETNSPGKFYFSYDSLEMLMFLQPPGQGTYSIK